MRAVIYKRVSTEMQVKDGISLEVQEDRLKAYISSQGWELTEIYEDAGLSGKDTNRPAFQRMLKEAERKKFDIIVIYKLDRLSRSVKDFHILSDKLDKLNISLVSVTQHLDTGSPTGRLLRNILMDFANFERELIGERSMASKIALAEKGRWIGAKPPFGYKWDRINKQLVNIQDERIMQIVNDYISGFSIDKLVDKYKLKIATIRSILTSPTYCGKVGFLMTSAKNGRVRKDKEDWILTDGQHEPYYDYGMWLRLQDLKYSKYRIPGERTQPQLFQNLIFCNCGKRMYFYKTFYKHKKTGELKSIYKLYRCDSCKKRLNEEAIENIIKKLIEIKDLKFESKNTSIKSLQIKHSTIEDKIKNLINNLSQITSMIVIKKIESEILELEQKAKLIRSEIDRSENTTIDNNLINELLNNYYEHLNFEEKKNVLSLLFKKIIVNENTATLVFSNDYSIDIFL